MTEEDSKFLTLAIGKCWHEFGSRYHPDCCVHCGNWLGTEPPARPLFNTWEEFGLVWEWATQQEWWDKFLFFSRVNMDDILEKEGVQPVSHSCMGLVNPTRFPQLITDFLREKEGK